MRLPYEIEIVSQRLAKSVTCRVEMQPDTKSRSILNYKVKTEAVNAAVTKRSTSRSVQVIVSLEIEAPSSREIPPYYLSRDGKEVLVGLTFDLNNSGKIPVRNSGTLFYPIGIRGQYTGLGFSVNAPFLLDMDRDRIVIEDEWNKSLLFQSGRRVGRVLSSSILPKYGPYAYLLFLENDAENSLSHFCEPAFESTKPYVINDNYEPGRNQGDDIYCGCDKEQLTAYMPADVKDDKIIPNLRIYPAAVDQIGKNQLVSRHLAKLLSREVPNTVRHFLMRFGIKPFTIHSLCELLVNDGSTKKTFGNTSGWHYPSRDEFVKHYSDIATVRLQLDAIHLCWDSLSLEEIAAIKTSDWLVAADGSPGCLKNLQLWLGDLRSLPDPIKDSVLHPQLANHPVFSRGGKTKGFRPAVFNIMEYVQRKAKQWSELQNDEKDKAFLFIIRNWKHILGITRPGTNLRHSKKLATLRAILREFPMLKDSQGNWVTVGQLRMPDEKTRCIFGQALHFPHTDIPKSFLSALRVNTRIKLPEDVLKRCDMLDQATHEEIFALEDYLSSRQLNNVMRREIYGAMRSVCKLGGKEVIVRTSTAYTPSEIIEKSLGTNIFPVLLIRNQKVQQFYRRIGVRELPDFQDMVTYVKCLAEEKEILRDRNAFYIELAKSAERNNLATEDTSSLLVILIGQRLFPPENIIIGNNFKKYFKRGIRYWPENRLDPLLAKSLKRLGCRDKVGENNLVDYLRWVSSQYSIDKMVGLAEQKGIERAYTLLETLPAGKFSDIETIFLSRSGRLFSMRDINDGILCIDDVPELANRLSKQGVPVDFAYYGQGRLFFDSAKVRRLSQFIETETVRLGDRNGEDVELSHKIASRFMKNALISANKQVMHGILDNEKIKGLRQAVTYDSIDKEYLVKSTNVTIPVRVALSHGDQGYVLCLLKDWKDYGAISKELSAFLVKDRSQIDLPVDFITILLYAQNEKQILDYLALRGIDYIDYSRTGKGGIEGEPKGETEEEPNKEPEEKPTPKQEKKAGGQPGNKNIGGSLGRGSGNNQEDGLNPPGKHATAKWRKNRYSAPTYRGSGHVTPHAIDYGEERNWVRASEHDYCQVCAMFCENCVLRGNKAECDCEVKKNAMDALHHHHLESLGGDPTKDTRGNLAILCPYHHKQLDGINFRLGYLNNKILIDERKNDFVLTVYPKDKDESEVKMKFSKEHFSSFLSYVEERGE